MTRADTTQTRTYLHVMAQFENGQAPRRWNVFQLSDTSPRITFAGSIASYRDARRLAAKAEQPLQIAAAAWEQMVAAGCAPRKAPKDATIT
jgi:hypothetical protein